MSGDPLDITFEPVLGEVVENPLEAVRAGILNQHENLIFMPPVELHSGPRRRVVAAICLFHRHDNGAYHHARLELTYCTRKTTKRPFVVDQKAVIDGKALETLLAQLLLTPRGQTISDLAGALLVPLNGTPLSVAPEAAGQLAQGIATVLTSEQGLQAVGSGLLSPDAVENLAAATQQARYKQAVAELRAMMDDATKSEHDFQRWFELHPWVFGTEYLRRIDARTIHLHSQADILLVSVDGFVDVFELKKPTATALRYDESHKTYYPAPELAKVLAQAMHYLRHMNESRLALGEDWGESIFRPRAIVVIGRSDDWNAGQRQAWRDLNATLQNIHLLTFDHVLARAEQLIRLYERRNAPMA